MAKSQGSSGDNFPAGSLRLHWRWTSWYSMIFMKLHHFSVFLSFSRCLEMPSDLNKKCLYKFPLYKPIGVSHSLCWSVRRRPHHFKLNPQQRPLTWGTHQALRYSNRRHKDFQLVCILRFSLGVFMLRLRCWMKKTGVWKLFLSNSSTKKTAEFGGLANASGSKSTSLQCYTSKARIFLFNRGKK